MSNGMHMPPTAPPIPQQRIAQKLDEYMSKHDYAGAQRHLIYWLEEARAVGDQRGELMVRNELVGHFRKTGNADQAFAQAERALALVDELGYAGSISAGTTYTNVATAYNAFGRNDESLALFRKAADAYESSEYTEPQLLGGLYNNMALVCVSLGSYREADELFRKALDTMANVKNGVLEQAITYLNMADAFVAERAEQMGADPIAAGDAESERTVETLLDQALELLDTPTVPRDGYYAFVCEKCAPVFAHYGYFLADADLKERARSIYERA